MPNTSKRLIIFGAGGFGRAVAELAIQLAYWRDICFVDDRWPDLKYVDNYDVISNISNLCNIDFHESDCICAIGNNQLRSFWTNEINKYGAELTNIIHPSAILSPSLKTGSGCIIMAGCIIGANITLGDGVILNSGCVLDHDVKVGDFSYLGIGVKIASANYIENHSNLKIGTCLGH